MTTYRIILQSKMGYSFGRSSLIRAKDVTDILVQCASMSLMHSKYDMSIPWRGGKRTAAQQKELFDDKATKCDGYIKKSYHQSGQALDVVPWHNGKLDYKATDRFEHFAKIMLATFDYLQVIGDIPQGIYLHWGGFWSARDENGDGYLHHIDDEFGWDCPHWEIRSKPQRNKLKFLNS